MKRFEVYWVPLDPTQGREIRKTRPAIIISPDEFHALGTCIIAPLTSTIRPFPWRVPTEFNGKQASIALDQLRAVDVSRIGKRMGVLDQKVRREVLEILAEIFFN